MVLNKEKLILRDKYQAVPSKSVAHRAIVCAAFSDAPTKIEIGSYEFGAYGDDVKRTLNAVEKLGAKIEMNQNGFTIYPINLDQLMSKYIKDIVVIECQESGTTYRFFDEILKELGVRARLTGTARLIYRVTSDAPTSQTISGKLLARGIKRKPVGHDIPADSDIFDMKDVFDMEDIKIDDNQTSLPYIHLTQKVMQDFGGAGYISPGKYKIEGDWSQASYYLSMGALSNSKLSVSGLRLDSVQGDKAILDILDWFGAKVARGEDEITIFGNELIGLGRINMSEIPDLLPTVSVLSALAKGETVLENISHLRFKESDRIKSVCDMINAVGGHAEEYEDLIRIIGDGKPLKGGRVETYGDHRIAMSATILALGSEGDVIVSHAECVEKSFPEYWKMLGI